MALVQREISEEANENGTMLGTGERYEQSSYYYKKSAPYNMAEPLELNYMESMVLVS